MKLTLQKLEGLAYGENCIIITWTGYEWSTRVTDGRTGDRIWCAKHIMLSRAKMRQNARKRTNVRTIFKKILGGGTGLALRILSYTLFSPFRRLWSLHDSSRDVQIPNISFRCWSAILL